MLSTDYISHKVYVVWRDDCSDWRDTAEKGQYLASRSTTATSGESNTYVLRHGIKGDIDHNKSIYVGMILYNGVLGKRTLTGKSASANYFLSLL
jgi:hypothetical protein